MNIDGTIGRMATLPRTQRLALTATLIALGVVLGYISIPVGPAKISPSQHFINVLAGVLVGPWYALITAFAISVIRNGVGAGTFLAFPGSMFGALFVGLAYHYVRRTDLAAFVEPLGTAVVGALVGYALIAPLEAKTVFLGFITANPASNPPWLAGLAGPVALMVLFAVSSIPGSTLGFLALRALRRAGLSF